MRRLQFAPREQPVIAQIWGKHPENYYKTTLELVEMGFAGVDINMGCPVKTVVKNGCCSALIQNRVLASEIIQAVKEGAKGIIPVSVKSRLGFNDIDMTWADFLLQQKIDMLTVHGRTVKDLSKVPANWEAIEEVRKLRDIVAPATLIVGNGDVMNRKQGLEFAKRHTIDGIMIGRGVFQDPFAFSDNSLWQTFTEKQRVNLFKRHVQLFQKTWGDNSHRINTLNKFCKIYIQGFEGSKEKRESLMKAQTTKELLNLLS